MSIEKSKKIEDELTVLVNAKKLCLHIVKITQNSKIFTDDYRSLTEKIRDTAYQIYICGFEANNWRVNGKLEAEARILEQTKAILACKDLIGLISIAKAAFHLRANKVRFVREETKKVRVGLENWRESDKKRYRPYLTE